MLKKKKKVIKCVSPILVNQSHFPESHLAVARILFYRLSHTQWTWIFYLFHTHEKNECKYLFHFYSRWRVFLFTIKILTFLLLVHASSSDAGSRRETFHSWQRSWGRGLGIRKGGIEPRECPRIFSSIYPPKKPESAYFIALCSHIWLYWGLSPTTISLSLSKS